MKMLKRNSHNRMFTIENMVQDCRNFCIDHCFGALCVCDDFTSPQQESTRARNYNQVLGSFTSTYTNNR